MKDKPPKPKSDKPKKKRADKYDPPLKLNASFDDVIKVAVSDPGKPSEEKKTK